MDIIGALRQEESNVRLPAQRPSILLGECILSRRQGVPSFGVADFPQFAA